MTDINDFPLYMNYWSDVSTTPFVPMLSSWDTQMFSFPVSTPENFWTDKINFNFKLPDWTYFWNNQNNQQNTFNIDFGTNTQKPLFQTPSINLSNPTLSFSSKSDFTSSGMFDTFTLSKPSLSSISAQTKKYSDIKPKPDMSIGNYKPFRISDYNVAKGEKLAALSKEYTHYRFIKNGSTRKIDKSRRKPSDGKASFTRNCALYVGLAIRDSGLGEYPYAHGYQMAAKLRQNSNFREIPVEGTDWKHLPAGCILCYSHKRNHVEITQPNGTATSDGTTHNIRKPDAIFVPV